MLIIRSTVELREEKVKQKLFYEISLKRFSGFH
jgi:hypothetical protein